MHPFKGFAVPSLNFQCLFVQDYEKAFLHSDGRVKGLSQPLTKKDCMQEQEAESFVKIAPLQ